MRDSLLLKERTSHKEHLMIERIAKLLVSNRDTQQRYLTKDMLLKIAKVTLSHSIAIKPRIVGKKFCLLVSNQ